MEKDPAPFKTFLGKSGLPAPKSIDDGSHVNEMVGRLNNLKDEMDELDGEWKYSLKTLKYSLKKSLAPLWMVSKFQIQTKFEEIEAQN